MKGSLPEHDLGTAHGRIEIDADIDGVGSAIAQMAALQAVIKGLEGPVSKLDSAMDSVTETTGTFQKILAKTTEAASSLGSTVADVAGQVAGLTGVTGMLDGAMTKVMETTQQTAAVGYKLFGVFQALKNPADTLSSALRTVGYNMFGITEELSKFPQWTKTIMKTAGAVGFIGASAANAQRGLRLAERGFVSLMARSTLFATGSIGVLTVMSKMYNSSNIVGKGLRYMGANLVDARDKIVGIYNQVDKFTGGLSKMVIGAALATSGFKQLTKIAGVLKNPKALLGIAAGLGAIAAMGPAISVLLGVANAVKQLSGAALILPGALAALAPAAGVLLFAFKGIGGAFSAAAKDGEEFDEALKDLGPGMQNVARAAHSFKGEFKDLKRIIEEGVWHGMSRNIRQIGGTYMPILRNGTEQVSKSLNKLMGGFADFAKNGRTVADFNQLMGISARTTGNLAKAFHPFMAILRDVGMVGAQVFEELTRGAGGTTQKWADFISKAKESGKLREWIQGGLDGLRDLKNIIRDVSVGIGDMLRGLGGGGEDPLSRMAKSAAKFREAMDGGHSNGGFNTFARTVETIREKVVSLVSVIVTGLEGALRSTATLAASFGTGFASGFSTAVAAATGLIAAISGIMGAFGPFAEIIGTIVGVALAFKGILLVLTPVIAALKIMFGMGMMAKGFQSAMMAAALAVERIGVKAGVSSATVGRLTGAMTTLAMAMGAVMAAVALVAVGFMAVSASGDAIKKANDNVASSAENAKVAYAGLVDAFMSSRGAVDKGVAAQMADNLAVLRNDLETTADTMTSRWQDLGASLNDAFNWDAITGKGGNAKRHEEIDKVAKKAEEAAASFQELDKTNKELAEGVTGTDEAFRRLVNELQNTSNGGSEAIQKIAQQRAEFVELRDAMADVGPAGIVLSEGLAAIADESSTATDKMNGLLDVMRSLGLIETTAQEAAMALSEDIAQVAKEAESQVNLEASIGYDNLTTDDGWLDNTKENARSLYYLLTPLRDQLAIVAAEGGNVEAAFQEMLPELIKTGEAFGMNEEQTRKLVERYGFIPDKIETIMSVAGKEKAVEDLTQVKLLAEQAGEEPVKKKIIIQTEEALNALRQMGVKVGEWNPKTKAVDVEIPPGLGPEVVGKIQELLDGATTVTPLQIAPPKVAPVQNAGDFWGGSDNAPTPEGFMGPVYDPNAAAEMEALKAEAAEPIKPKIEPDITPVTIALDGVKTQILDVGANNPIQFQAGGTEAVQGAVANIQATVESLPDNVHVSVQETGAMGVYDALTWVATGVETAQIKFVTFVTVLSDGMTSAMGILSMFAMTVDTVLGGAASTAHGSGAALGQGFADGISSKAGEVQAAALKLAEAASAPLPRSPAKIGPFSGRGWTPFRGMSLAQGFAQGISAGTPLAQNATMNMAKAISDVMDNMRQQFQMPATSFGANKFGNGITNYYRDPEISDRQLKKDREDRAADERRAIREQAIADRKTAADNLPGAEERVLSARERVVAAEERIVKAEERIGKAKKAEEIEEARKALGEANDSLIEARIAESEAIADRDKIKLQAGTAKPTGVEGGLTPNRERTDYIEAMSEIASTFGLEMTSGLREGEANHHGSGRGADFSNGSGNTDEMLAFADFMERNFKPYIKELIYDDPRFQGREIKDGNNVDSSFYDGAGDHTNHVHLAVDFAPEFTPDGGVKNGDPKVSGAQSDVRTNIDASRTDLTQDEVASVIIARGKAMGMSDDEIKSALATGLVESNLKNLDYGDRDSLGAFQQRNSEEWTKGGARNRMNVDDAVTTYFEQLRNTEGSPGDRAQQVQRSAYPDKYAERMGEADAIFNRLSNDAGDALMVDDGGANDDLNRLRANNAELDNALKIATSPDSTDAQVIQALQTLDASMTGLDEANQDLISAQKDAIMEDRGIKEYDPFEGALETDYDKFKFGLKSAQDVFGMFNMLKEGLTNAGNVGKLLVRGLSNTNDVHSLVDGVQGMASTIGEIVSAVGTVANMAATVAATAGAAIPGIGQVGAVVSAVTGGIADVNAVVDLVQDVARAGGRMFGGALSSILGGENGQLQGNVKTLLDFNDNTMKTWSDRNAADRTVRSIGPGEARDPNAAGGIRDLNIYQGPGGNPQDMMNAAMFAVKAHNRGVYSG